MDIRIAATAASALLLASAAPAANSDYAGPITDMHAHVRFGSDDALKPNQPFGPLPIAKLDDSAGVTRSALIVIAHAGNMAKTRAQNDAVIAAARDSNGRFFPIASVHPADGQAALDELDRLAGLGVKIIKLHPNTQKFDVSDPAVGAVVDH